MPDPQQGEIWWANLPAPSGRRPVLILTRSSALPYLTNVTVAPLTRTVRSIPSEVVLSPEQGVRSVCAISLENILTVRKQMLVRKITQLDSAYMDRVFAAMRYVFAMPERR